MIPLINEFVTHYKVLAIILMVGLSFAAGIMLGGEFKTMAIAKGMQAEGLVLCKEPSQVNYSSLNIPLNLP